jgi:hypothetical protein
MAGCVPFLLPVLLKVSTGKLCLCVRAADGLQSRPLPPNKDGATMLQKRIDDRRSGLLTPNELAAWVKTGRTSVEADDRADFRKKRSALSTSTDAGADAFWTRSPAAAAAQHTADPAAAQHTAASDPVAEFSRVYEGRVRKVDVSKGFGFIDPTAADRILLKDEAGLGGDDGVYFSSRYLDLSSDGGLGIGM